MTDLVERLRERCKMYEDSLHAPALKEAADEIERLRERAASTEGMFYEIERLRAQVKVERSWRIDKERLLQKAQAEIERLRNALQKAEQLLTLIQFF